MLVCAHLQWSHTSTTDHAVLTQPEPGEDAPLLLLLLFCLSCSTAERSGFSWADDLGFLGFSTGGFVLASQEGT